FEYPVNPVMLQLFTPMVPPTSEMLPDGLDTVTVQPLPPCTSVPPSQSSPAGKLSMAPTLKVKRWLVQTTPGSGQTAMAVAVLDLYATESFRVGAMKRRHTWWFPVKSLTPRSPASGPAITTSVPLQTAFTTVGFMITTLQGSDGVPLPLYFQPLIPAGVP